MLTEVKVPVSFLLDPELTTSAKLLWLLRRLHADAPPPRASLLAAQSGLSTETIRTTLPRLAAIQFPAGPTAQATLPGPLLTDHKLLPGAKVLYGVLQGLGRPKGEFTYPTLSRLTGAGPNTLKRSVAALVEAEWLTTEQKNRKAPVSFALCNPVVARQWLEVRLARSRVSHAPHRGEALMKEYLSLLIDSNEFQDNARPGFLIHPKTGELLELDRYYINVAGFEYNGAPHLGTSPPAREQQTRDAVKVGICALRKIPVAVVHREDISLDGMRQVVEGLNLFTLRDLAGHGPLIEYLERRARRHREGDGSRS